MWASRSPPEALQKPPEDPCKPPLGSKPVAPGVRGRVRVMRARARGGVKVNPLWRS